MIPPHQLYRVEVVPKKDWLLEKTAQPATLKRNAGHNICVLSVKSQFVSNAQTKCAFTVGKIYKINALQFCKRYDYNEKVLISYV